MPNINQNQGTEDIFADADNSQQPAAVPPVQPQFQNRPPYQSAASAGRNQSAPLPGLPVMSDEIPPATPIPGAEVPSPRGGRKLMIMGIFIIVTVLAGAGFLFYRMMTKNTNDAGLTNNANNPTNTSNNNANTAAVNNANSVANLNLNAAGNLNADQTKDSDGDGLMDAEEITLGTNILKADSDSDALPDLDEVRVYKTNPLKADTDGDGFLDGEEVRNGYDPNKGGGAKLRDLGNEINKLTNQ